MSALFKGVIALLAPHNCDIFRGPPGGGAMAYFKQLNRTLALMHQALICRDSHHGEGCLNNPPLQRTPRQQFERVSGQLKRRHGSE